MPRLTTLIYARSVKLLILSLRTRRSWSLWNSHVWPLRELSFQHIHLRQKIRKYSKSKILGQSVKACFHKH